MIVALARKLVIALWHYWRTTGGRRLTSSVLKGLGTSIPLSTIFGARAGFQHDCRTDDPRWREAVFEPGTDADRENGPAARSLPPMRMTASWSGSNDPTAYKTGPDIDVFDRVARLAVEPFRP